MASDNKHQPFVSLEFVTCRNMLWQEKKIPIDFSLQIGLKKGVFPGEEGKSTVTVVIQSLEMEITRRVTPWQVCKERQVSGVPLKQSCAWGTFFRWNLDSTERVLLS